MVALGRAGILNPALPHDVRDDAWTPRRPPLTPEEYAERDVSPAFLTYLRRFDGMVAG
jgi:2,4-dienoyl-CoA reductase-like NADH-dependent reductase (Old Yellow Enzyme family)